jgi:hypothetical protein
LWESHRKVRDPILKRAKRCEEVQRGAEYFSSEDFQRNCEVVKLVVVLQQYSTFTQQRVTQPLEIRDRPRHCLNYSSSSTYRTEVSQRPQHRRPNRLGNSTHSTGPTEAVLSTDLSQQQRPQYWSYRGSTFGSSNSSTRQYSAAPFKRPEVLLTGLSTASAAALVQARTVPHSTSSTCPRQDSTPFFKQALLKVLPLYPKHGS